MRNAKCENAEMRKCGNANQHMGYACSWQFGVADVVWGAHRNLHGIQIQCPNAQMLTMQMRKNVRCPNTLNKCSNQWSTNVSHAQMPFKCSTNAQQMHKCANAQQTQRMLNRHNCSNAHMLNNAMHKRTKQKNAQTK